MVDSQEVGSGAVWRWQLPLYGAALDHAGARAFPDAEKKSQRRSAGL